MQVTKGTWRMHKQCVPGSFPPPPHKSLGTRLPAIVQHNTKFCYSAQSSNSRQLLSGVQLQTPTLALLHTECHIPLYFSNIATGSHEVLFFFFLPVCHSLFAKLLGIHFVSAVEPLLSGQHGTRGCP